MDIKQALTEAAMADTFAPGFGERRLAELPKTDVIVQRSLLRSALARINALEQAIIDYTAGAVSRAEHARRIATGEDS